MTYDWLAALAYLATTVLVTMAGKRLAFAIPALEETRLDNRRVDKPKLERESYKDLCQQSNKVGLWANLGFLVLMLPWCVSFESRPLWQHALETLGVLAIFDFMYYWTHRSLFHGTLLRKVHAMHHQARHPTYMDSHYVHPLETFIGLALFYAANPILALMLGRPLHPVSAALAMVLFTQLNSLNHVYTNLPREGWLFRTVDYITGVHHAHHVDMNQGNFATLTMFYDKLFGTYETPVKREAI